MLAGHETVERGGVASLRGPRDFRAPLADVRISVGLPRSSRHNMLPHFGGAFLAARHANTVSASMAWRRLSVWSRKRALWAMFNVLGEFQRMPH